MSPSSTLHDGQYDTKYVTFEWLLRAAFMDKNWGDKCVNQLVSHTININTAYHSDGGLSGSLRHEYEDHAVLTFPSRDAR